MRVTKTLPVVMVAGAFICGPATAQWISFTNDTINRMPVGVGLNTAATSTTCPEEKDYAWGDVDQDGDLDLICMRKRPLSCEGGRPNVLFMNENGVLIDRTQQYASASIGVPAAQGTSFGFLDSTNDRQAVLVDLDNDGWLDIVTCTTMSDGLPQYIGHPRIYMNLGKDGGGNWLGFRYEYNRIPTIPNKAGNFLDTVEPITSWYNPRFCSVAAGDLNNDGYVDLYFSDYDTPENAYCPLISESASHDMDNKLLINGGALNPGTFSDESNARMSVTCNCGGNLNFTAFGAHGLIYDMNGDGLKDIVKLSTLGTPQHIAVIQNNTANPGDWTGTSNKYKNVYNSLGPYFMQVDDLNNDGRFDIVVSDDGADRVALNTGNDANQNPNMSLTSLNAEFDFSGPSLIADWDNDGWKDFVIFDQDIDTNYVTSRRGRFYRNTNGTSFAESGNVMPQTSNKAVYNGATFDIDRDGWLDVILGKGNPSGGHNAGSTDVWMNNGKPDAVITYPSGRPVQLSPDVATEFDVQIVGAHGGTVTGANLFVSVNGGAFASTPMTSLGGNLYRATIAAQTCGTGVRYYVSANVSGTVMLDPKARIYNTSVPTSNYQAFAAASTQVARSDDFERGVVDWTVQNDASLTSGGWEVAIPNGTWNEGFRAAPHQAATGSRAFVTQNGTVGGALAAADVDGGPTHLISPTIDLLGSNGVVSFARWFYSNHPSDRLLVYVSNDNGSNWVLVKNIQPHRIMSWSADSDYKQTEWVTESFTVSDYVAPTAQVRVRFTANDVAPASFVEAGIDSFEITKLGCIGKPPVCEADIAPPGGDQNVGVPDLLFIISNWGGCGTPCPADIAPPGGDGAVGVPDLLKVISSWGPC